MIAILMDNHGLVARFTVSHDHIAISIVISIILGTGEMTSIIFILILTLIYTYEAQGERHGITRLLENLFRLGIRLKDINTTQSSLEDIFVDLVRKDA